MSFSAEVPCISLTRLAGSVRLWGSPSVGQSVHCSTHPYVALNAGMAPDT